jgi:antitoxin (DNA-binding transcriptional repressor) of toxin-antitoxin stability system
MVDRMTVRMTEAELARDLHTVLEKVRQGAEVVVEQDSRPVAVIKAPVGEWPQDIGGDRRA